MLFPLQLRNITIVEQWFNWRKARNMKLITLLTIAAVALTVTVAAFAAGPSTPWTVKDMKTAIRAIAYPKPHPVRLTCTGQGAADSSGRFASFRCTATYRHHVRKRFVIEGQGEGGWLCASKTPAPCALLRHGFVTTAAMNAGSLAAAADLAARGYLVNHDQFPYQVVHFCQQAGVSWSCPFTVNGAAVTVTVSMKGAKGGYVTTAAATSQ